MPRRRSRLLPLCLAAGVAAVAAWGLLPGPAAPAPDGDAEAAGEGVEGSTSAHLVARATAGPVEALVAKGRAAIQGVVRRLGTPVSARIEAYRKGRPGGLVPASWLEEGDGDLPASSILEPKPTASAAAGEDGRYRVGPLDPGTYQMVAIAADGARGAGTVRIVADGAVLGFDIDLRFGPERLVGRAVKADGTPWRGHVAAAPGSTWETPPLHGLAFVPTDEDGRFTLTGLERGRIRVVALLDRALRVTSAPVDIPRSGPEWTFVVDAGLREVFGRVVEEASGRALAGAAVTVTAWSYGDSQSLRSRGIADADGRWRALAAAVDGSATATAVGFVAATRVVGEGQKEIDFRLVRAARVHGRVLSEADGAPLAGVAVLAVTLDADTGARAVSGPDGRYEIPEVAPGSVMVAAFGGGWWSKALLQARPSGFNPLVVEVKADSNVEVDVLVVPAAKAQGKVVDAKGVAVAGALVGWTGAPPAGSSLYDFSWATEGSRASSGPDGAFTADSLIPGFSYTFQAAASGQIGATAGPFEAELKAPVAVELKFPAPRWLDATVEGPGGRPVAGAIVQTWFQAFGHEDGAKAVSDAKGKARVGPLPAGQLWVMAHDPGTWNGNWQQVGGEDGEGSTTTELTATLTLNRGGGVRGRLLYPDGSPVSDRTTTIQLTGPNVNWTMQSTLSDGRFQFDGVADGTYRLEVKLDPNKPAVVGTTITSGGGDVEVTVPAEPAKRTTIEIVDGEGKPVPQASLLHAGTDQGAGNATVYDGKWKCPANSGEAWVEVHSPASAAGSAIPWAPKTVGPIAEGTERVEVRLEPERRIEGVVRGGDGRGVRGVRVRAMPTTRAKALEGQDVPHDATLSDPEGRFRLGRLWAGEYRLFVDAAETYAPFEPVTVQSGSLSVDLVLSQGLLAAVPVLDWRGRPLAKATLTAAIEGRQSVRAVTDAQGIARLVGLDRTRAYRLELEVAGGGENLGVVIDPWKPSEEPIRARHAAFVGGVVRDTEGRLVGGARVTLIDEAGETNSAETEGDGKFRFEPVAPGEYRVYAAASNDGPRTSSLATVTAGAREVSLVLAPAHKLTVRFQGFVAPEGDTWAALAFDGRTSVVENAQIQGGVAKFEYLDPDATYQIYLRLDADPSRIAFRRGISGRAGEVTVPFESARSIRGRLVAPRGTQGFGVRVHQDGLYVDGKVDDEGRYEILGLPDGTFRLHGWATLDGATIQGDGEAAAGGSLDFELRIR